MQKVPDFIGVAEGKPCPIRFTLPRNEGARLLSAKKRSDRFYALPVNAAFTRSGINGTVRSRVPVAS